MKLTLFAIICLTLGLCASAAADSVKMGERLLQVETVYLTPVTAVGWNEPILLGRKISGSDFRRGSEGAAVISRAVWQGHFGKVSAIGRLVHVNEYPYRIVGIADEASEEGRGAKIWLTRHK